MPVKGVHSEALMKPLITLLFMLVFPIVARSDDTPNALIRKSDGVIVGVGYTDFSGVENLRDYEVKAVDKSQMESISVGIKRRFAEERAINEEKSNKTRNEKAKGLKQKLGLSDSEWDDLVSAVRN